MKFRLSKCPGKNSQVRDDEISKPCLNQCLQKNPAMRPGLTFKECIKDTNDPVWGFSLEVQLMLNSEDGSTRVAIFWTVCLYTNVQFVVVTIKVEVRTQIYEQS